MIGYEEKKLIHALKSGNSTKINKAFEQIYNDYVKLVAFIISKYVNNDEDVKDLTNDTFIKFFNNIDSVEKSIKSYLSAIAKNIAINFAKSQKETIEMPDNLPDDSYVSSSNLKYRAIIEEFKKYVSDDELEIIIMHVVEGHTFEEIGQTLGKNKNTIKTIYNRSKAKLQEAKGGLI